MSKEPEDEIHSEPGASGDDPTLEARLKRLDEIVSELEGGGVELEQGLALFEEGIRHIRESERLISTAELKVEELVGRGEQLKTRPLEDGGQ